MAKGNIITPRTLSGFMELPPQEQVLFERIKATLEDTYQMYGFYPIDTPVLEYSNVLLAKSAGETEKQVYRFNKGDKDLSMRFDLTVPLAKYVAKNYSAITFPFKRYAIGKVYRGERAQKGRFREFYQADIDIIGDGSLSIVNDAEIPSIIYSIFTDLGLSNFTIRINNRKVLNGLFEMNGLDDSATDIMRVIDKIDKIGVDATKAELIEVGVTEEVAATLIDIMTYKDTNANVIAKLEGYKGRSEVFDLGLSELSDVIYYIGKFGVPEENYRIDLSIARGLDYYTGTVYETFVNDHPEIGSVCSGGRYDNLAEYYTKKSLPGVGMSIGLTRFFYILNEYKYLNTKLNSPADVLIIPMTDDMSAAVSISATLRECGIRTQIYMEKKKFKAKITYANKLSIPFAMFLGEDEIAADKVTIKNMITGNQETLDLDAAIDTMVEVLEEMDEESIITK
ncbi:MAG: histidine--tRNA ligase [Lachnospiraceae bacterium]|nr:histidine--tRNA ligase [Lachnospiraceae bacterium]